MIMIDIYVPAVDKEYDFTLDANVKIKLVIEEISEMISHKEQSEIVGSVEDFILCDRDKKTALPDHMTLHECGIRTGSKMMLI